MHFLKAVLFILNELSLQFQKDSCGLPEASEALKTACLKLVALKLRPGENRQNFLDIVDGERKFKGVKLSEPTLTEEQFKHHKGLVQLVIDHITKRIGDMDSDHLMKDMQVFYPVNLPESEAERAMYGRVKSIPCVSTIHWH